MDWRIKLCLDGGVCGIPRYAYTLSGHEYAANEDFDKALTCYRNALRFDTRHYNAM